MDSMNLTTNGLNTIPAFGSVIPFVIVLAIVIGVISAALSYAFFRKLMKYFEIFGSSVIYAVVGSVVCVGTGLLYLLADAFIKMNQDGTIRLEYYLYAIVGYSILAGIGYLSVYIFDRLEKNYNKKN